jgi:hypothetical protein
MLLMEHYCSFGISEDEFKERTHCQHPPNPLIAHKMGGDSHCRPDVAIIVEGHPCLVGDGKELDTVV